LKLKKKLKNAVVAAILSLQFFPALEQQTPDKSPINPKFDSFH
jgi:hypothetical protein